MKKVIMALALGMLIGSSTVALAAPNTIQATVEKFRILIDGQAKNVTSNQLVYKGTTYVPIRETAELFKYDTRYDGKNKTIEFMSKESFSDDWTSLSDFVIINKFQLETNGTTYKVLTNNNTILSINSDSIRDGDLTNIVTEDGKIVQVKKFNESILLSKEDLKKAGFKI